MMPKIVSVQHSTRRHLTSFVGRKAELNDVRRLLSDKRLVTLTGPDGMGKSRLALQIGAQIAHEFTYGRWDCDLATVTDRDCVSISMLNALGLPVQPGLSAIDTFVGVINDARVLLVLDHCEHLLDACAAIIDSLLRSCPRLTILTTSTEAIGLAGELTWRVPPLSLTNDAIELFVDRARRVRSDFAINADTAVTVGEICRRLDGVPLAIELAAARTDTLSPVEILAGLNDRFRLVAGAAGNAVRPEQTLCATVQWSHALLSGPERALLHRLAVFAGGFDLDGAQAVGANDEDFEGYQTLGRFAELVDKAFVVVENNRGRAGYRLLYSVRQYALEKLSESGEADAVLARYRKHLKQPNQVVRAGSGGVRY
ncbi:LuxR family transcriptional regulator [Mycobacterium tuberculosis]|nr:LuxR family transcriptional regulator [Mycobacterium tuberculosis]CKV48623.1 LuxR family transcriptional regulator [Mycobacterium tuberculosis]CKW45730.1 LuxR family transcriptional regulator [Mycobacterium tuberculosis]CKW48191.1 LuxR family transcriptional regulator [Mycobacterium tuberculosis]CKW63044.1 LuxR family transcriptional regulator [Mycobacterium tuberculosis]